MASALGLGITLVASGAVSTGIVFGALKLLKGQVTGSLLQKCAEEEERLEKLEEAISKNLGLLKPMKPYTTFLEKENTLKELQAKLESEKEALKKLDEALNRSQSQVDDKEEKQNELKMGKEKSEEFAKKLRSEEGQLKENSEATEAKFGEALSAYTTAIEGLNAEEEKQKSLQELQEQSEALKKHLSELAVLHEQSVSRYFALEGQFQQLENEYRGLVEKELSGEA